MRSCSALLISCFVCAVVVCSPAPQAAAPQNTPAKTAPSVPPAAERYATVVNQYCVTCHNQRLKTAGLSLDTLDLTKIGDGAEVWEKVARKVRTGAMPPPGARHLAQGDSDALIGWLEGELDRHAAAHPNPGRPQLHRLNRAEYANAIRDLLALDIEDVSAWLPPDDSAYGFDTIADFLGVSRTLLESYLTAAGGISALAVGNREVVPGTDTYLVRQDLSQDKHLEGQPFGTVGGAVVKHMFPVDGEYVIQTRLHTTNVGETRGLEHQHEIEFTVDGVRAGVLAVGPPPTASNAAKGGVPGVTGRADGRDEERARNAKINTDLQVRLPVKAGPRSIGVAFIQRSRAVDAGKMQPYLRSSFDTFDATGVPHIQSVIIRGPFNVTGSGDTPSRRQIFVCHPANEAAEEPCATRIVWTLARRAYRQPVAPGDLRRLMDFYHSGRKDGTFESGIESAIQRLLASPKFLLRIENDPPAAPAGKPYRVTDLELASRLSFFLWSSIPDEELLTVASQGKLKQPLVLRRQVQRMLADPKSEALVSNFAGQWLQLRNLTRVVPDPDQFPDFDDNLRQAFQREAEMLFESVMREDRNVQDLLTADYTFVNERLAKHYGIPYIYGSHFRRVPVTDEARKGLLGKGAILLVTSNADRTSPVVRGKWVLENLIGTPPPPPPANVPPLKENKDRTKPLTMREQMEEHRANAACASCHKLMDPIGLAMENFDAVGAWRDRDVAGSIDASGQLFDGTKVDGVVALRRALMQHPEVFVRTMTEKLLTYALGRGLEYYDMPAVREIVRDAGKQGDRFSSIIMGIAASEAFQMRIKASPDRVVPASTTAQR